MGVCAAQHRHGPIEDDIQQTDMQYPLYAVSMADFLAMNGTPPCHQQLMKDGRLHVWSPGMFLIFMSHQWTSNSHPDPTGEQLAIVRSAFRGILDGSVYVTSDVVSENLTLTLLSTNEKSRRKFAASYLWFDWFSVPQPSVVPTGSDASATIAAMHAAISSIPDYVRCAEVFIVAAPPVRHSSTDRICDSATWYKRGWCRLEAVCRLLAPRDDAAQIVIINSKTNVTFTYAASLFSISVGRGEFTVDSDRAILYPVLRKALDQKLQVLELRGRRGLFMMRYLTAMTGVLVSGLRDEEDEVLDEAGFLRRYFFRSWLDHGDKGWSPLYYAGIEGNIPMIRAAAAAGARGLTELASRPATEIGLPRSTALHVTCGTGKAAAVACLIDLRADIHQLNSTGFDSIHCSVIFNAEAVPILELLLERAADVQRRATNGASYLHLAALHRDHDTSYELMRLLLSRGVRPDSTDMVGASVGHYLATLGASPDSVRLLLAWRADPNATYAAEGILGRLTVGLASLAVALGSRRETLRLFSKVGKSSWLQTAARYGRADMVNTLLEGRADPTLRGCNGQFADETARCHGFESLASTIELARCFPGFDAATLLSI